MRYYNTIPEEQETTINIDYYKKELVIYTSRRMQIERLMKKLGEPSRTYLVQNKVSGCRWNIPLNDTKSTSKVLSRPTLIGTLNRT